jgi:hypothetical protein
MLRAQHDLRGRWPGRVVREPSGVVHQVLLVSFVVLFLGTSLIHSRGRHAELLLRRFPRAHKR